MLVEIEGLLNSLMGCPKGTVALKDILSRHSGVNMYIPKETKIFKTWRNHRIRGLFEGNNYDELAKEWGLGKRQVRQIVDLPLATL